MDNDPLVAFLERIALLMELKGENPFKINSFKRAASIFQDLEEDPYELFSQGALQKIKGVGKGISQNLAEFFDRGSSQLLDSLETEVPEGLLEMMEVRGLGPARVRKLHETLGLTTLGELEYACQENRLVEIKGFGALTQAMILEEVGRLKQYAGLFHLHYAVHTTERYLEQLRSLPEVETADWSGDLRRGLEVISRGVLVAASSQVETVLDLFSDFPELKPDLKRRPGRLDASHAMGLPLTLHVVPPEKYAFRLFQTTGSTEHLEMVQERAGARSLEGGVDEAALYRSVDLAFIPPELREGEDEVDQASKGEFPALIRVEDVQGILHVHTTYSDGAETIEAMARAAMDRGYTYLGITDHSRTASYAGGLSIDKLKKQGEEIAGLNEELSGFRILHGVESDILKDGSLDYPDEVLADLDFVIASVHSGFSMGEEAMTARLIEAVRNPHTRILGHPTGRLLLGRDAYSVDLDAVLEACAEAGVMVELNANPHRLDLDWRWLKRSLALGIKIAINPDAHRIEGLDDIRYGIVIARKGGLRSQDTASALRVDELTQLWS